jgi:hypothetical protein
LQQQYGTHQHPEVFHAFVSDKARAPAETLNII